MLQSEDLLQSLVPFVHNVLVFSQGKIISWLFASNDFFLFNRLNAPTTQNNRNMSLSM